MDESQSGQQTTTTKQYVTESSEVFEILAKSEAQVGRPRQVLSAGALGFCLVAILTMLALPRLDQLLTTALYAFVVAMPLLVLEYICASFKLPTFEPTLDDQRSLWTLFVARMLNVGAWLEVPGLLATVVGLVAVVWHLNSVAGKVFLIASAITMLVWGVFGSVLWIRALLRLDKAKKDEHSTR